MIYGYLELFYAGIITLLTLVHFLRAYQRKDQIGLADFAVWTTGAYFGLSPFVSLIHGAEISNDDEGRYILPLYIANSLFLVGILVAKQLFAGLRQRTLLREGGNRKYPMRWMLSGISRVPVIVMVFLTLLFLAIRVYEMTLGGGFSTLNSQDVMDNKSYFFVIVENLGRATFSAVVIYVAYNLCNWTNVWVSFLMLSSLGVMSLLSGRREMVFYVYLAVFVIMIIDKSSRWKITVLSVLTVIGVGLFFIVFPVFLSLRTTLADYRQSDATLTNPIVLISQAFHDRALSSADMEYGDEYRTNVAGRLLEDRDFPLDILQAEERRPVMGGEALFNSIMYAFPRYLRVVNIFGSTKEDVLVAMDMPIRDVATTFASYFIADFGMIGGLIGGIFYGAICCSFEIMAFRNLNKNPLISVVLIGGVSFLTFSMEGELSLTFCLLRNLLIICGLIYLVNRLIPMQLTQTSEGQRQMPMHRPQPRGGRPPPMGLPQRPRPSLR
jgi:hypothetical protein